MRPLVILFAKAPLPGRVKTRLQPHIGLAAAVELHSAFVSDAHAKLASISEIVDVELSTDQETNAWEGFRGRRSVQAGGDLGENIYSALASGLGGGRSTVMVLGSDSPTLPVAHLHALLVSSADVALGPTADGGFYAICCRRVLPGMFDGVKWSVADTLKSTLEAMARSRLSVQLGPAWFDVDELADLHHLRDSPGLPCHTKRWFDRHER